MKNNKLFIGIYAFFLGVIFIMGCEEKINQPNMDFS